MKRRTTKNAFTLIELLAVIVILAIIALIAVPVILNIIDKANKSAFKDSAYGIIQAGEYYYAASQLDLEGPMETVEMQTTDSRLDLKGDIPDGSITITRDGDISISVSNGRYCATKGFNDKDVTITEGKCSNETKELVLGDPVYFNPKDNVICPDDYEPENSLMGVKDECMRWYVYKIEGDNVGLILDHNTTALTKWNETGENPDGPTTLEAQLESDTTNWQVEADIVEAEDIVTQLKWYQDLEDKTTWENQYMTDMETAVNNIKTTIQANESNYANALEMYKAMTNMLMTDYSAMALPSYLHEDLYSNCDTDGNCTTYGYWTKTAVASDSHRVWSVSYAGGLGHGNLDYGADGGLRPVIILSKSLISLQK